MKTNMEAIDYLAEELKKAEPVVDYLAEYLKREAKPAAQSQGSRYRSLTP